MDTEKERIICLIHERLWLSARSSHRVPPLMAPSLFLALSSLPSLFCLIPPPMSLTVFIFLHHPSCRPLLHLCSVPSLIPFSSVPCLPPPVSSSLPSINFFLLPHLLSFPIHFFPTLSAPKCLHACTHVHFFSYTLMSLSLVCLTLSLRHWQGTTVLSRACPSLVPRQAPVLGTH